MTLSFSPQNYTVEEGIPARIMVGLDKKAEAPITFYVTTENITAEPSTNTALRDYIHEERAEAIFLPGERKKELQVITLRDTKFEMDEYLKITLSPGPTTVQMKIEPDPAFITIFDRTGEGALVYVHTDHCSAAKPHCMPASKLYNLKVQIITYVPHKFNTSQL